ncbi:hypothetical protein CRENPOLYSF1_270068 [Crenothrix polyspora]|uniref:Uncharacterized protein n=1 Tax=Crenothrix polyspora TaxID=360316 RepID=A0A1R4H8X2_9GAMM|nr:hypothetical protein CRENPOLYSF1_270068 [Crenothrix polyspora]
MRVFAKNAYNAVCGYALKNGHKKVNTYNSPALKLAPVYKSSLHCLVNQHG